MVNFEELVDQLNRISNKERRENIKNLGVECVCKICPSYIECAKDSEEKFFCLTTKSNCIKVQKGCMCPTCPIATRYKIGIYNNFYCIRGTEIDQRRI